jgi:polyhydroxyalkanoate synthase subunit PhaC
MLDPAQIPQLSISPADLLQLQTEYAQKVQQELARSSDGLEGMSDKRFSSASWSEQPWASAAALYSLNREFMLKMVNAVTVNGQKLNEAGGAVSKANRLALERLRFFAEQSLDAIAPSNFLATNPDAQAQIKQSAGKSLQVGLANLLEDLKKGRMSQSDESHFVVGENLAITPGKVVFRNDLIELICYTPTTELVFERPFLMVPPCINKFYILDLQPDNSLVNYMLSQGHQVFMVSWKNVQADQGGLTWDDYLEQGVLKAIEQVQKLTAQSQINALGFCVGGTLLSAALAALAAKSENPVASLTLLTTLLDFSDPGVLGLFIDEQHCAWRESTLGSGGVMLGKELATTFSFLRPNDLVWNYVVSNYLKGQTPAPFDLLYWNADSTNLPGPMFTWYLRHMYLQNQLIEPGKLRGAGQALDLRAIECPAFVYGSKEDHIVPWTAAYQATQLLGGKTKFVLGASGHIAGVVNPAHKNKRNYWRAPENQKTTPNSSSEWLSQSEMVPGSWWGEWQSWLKPYGGKKVKTSALKVNRVKSLGNAPGSYVKARA